MSSTSQPVGGILELLGSFKPVTFAYRDFYVLTRIKYDRGCHVIGRVMTFAAVGKTLARLGEFADMVIDRMGTAATRIVFAPGAGPVVLSTGKTRAGWRIAVAGITSAACYNLGNIVYM